MSAYSDSFEVGSSSTSSSSSSSSSSDAPSKPPQVLHSDSVVRSSATDTGSPIASDRSRGDAPPPPVPVPLVQILEQTQPPGTTEEVPQMSDFSEDAPSSHVERKIPAYLAPRRSEFKMLDKFVAFCGSSRGMSEASDVERPRLSAFEEMAPPPPVRGAPEAEAESEAKAKTEAPLNRSGEWRNDDASEGSVLSTLSQHLARLEVPPAAAPAAQKEALSAAALPRAQGGTGDAVAIVPEPIPSTISGAIPNVIPNAMPNVIIRTELPAPPPRRMDFALPLAPPPLPPSAVAPDARVSELRETSEAVERLVRAFALLRGHSAPPPPRETTTADDAAPFASRETAPLTAMRAGHGVGDAGTMRWRRISPKRTESFRPPLPPPQTTAGDAPSPSPASAAEEVILSLVTEMLQQSDPRGPARPRGAAPCETEVIGMEEFRAPGASPAPRAEPFGRRGRPLSVFDGELRAFAPGDADAADALRHSIRSALDRYVSAHIAPRGWPATSAKAREHSAAFAWALQLDLLAVCLRALETRFAGGPRAAVRGGGTVWIRYDGPRDAEALARNAVHCLPFEALDARGGAGRMFRMEYWVTRDKLFVVADALASSVRDGIAAGADAYLSLRGVPHVDSAGPDALVLPRTPLFTLVPADPEQRDDEAHSYSHAHVHTRAHTHARACVHSDEGGHELQSFGLEPQTIEAVAHAISAAATDIIGAEGRGAFSEQYRDASSAVSEAVCELLSDEAIRAAVARRARAKISETQRRREADTRVDRAAKERAMIDAAEEEAERVVQRIMQEMRVEAATRA